MYKSIFVGAYSRRVLSYYRGRADNPKNKVIQNNGLLAPARLFPLFRCVKDRADDGSENFLTAL